MSNKYKELINELKEEEKSTSFLIIGYLTFRANRGARIIGEIFVDAGVFIITSMLIVRYGAAVGVFVNLVITVLWSAMTIELEGLISFNAIIMTGIYLVSVFVANSDISFLFFYSIACLSYLAIKETISFKYEKFIEENDRPLPSNTKLQHPTESE